ncbi:hypothetical protein H0H93_011154 [Arthromyces matolae]|nr:hypothetical protein H0H93_011154 [Arthromyces matolae]
MTPPSPILLDIPDWHNGMNGYQRCEKFIAQYQSQPSGSLISRQPTPSKADPGFLNDHDMFSKDCPSICPVNEDLEAFMRQEIVIRGLPADDLNKTLHLAASLIELAYHECTFSEKKQIALYNWYLIYIDDVSSKDITAYVAFEERFLQNIPQLDPVLDGLASVLRAMFDFYPVFFANSIISATFDFISGTCIEPAVESFKSSNSSPRFPWFLRARTGVAVGFALMLFPKSRQVDYVACFRAMADMDFWISATNDLLSWVAKLSAVYYAQGIDFCLSGTIRKA